MYATSVTCGTVAATTATAAAVASTASSSAPDTLPTFLVAETAGQLLQGIQLLGQLQPSTIILARDMAVPADTWPKGLLVNQSMVLAGLPPPAQRTLLDLYQVRQPCTWRMPQKGWMGGAGLMGPMRPKWADGPN